jgi:Protein of unknown function (DUF998)
MCPWCIETRLMRKRRLPRTIASAFESPGMARFDRRRCPLIVAPTAHGGTGLPRRSVGDQDPDTVSTMYSGQCKSRVVPAELACGVAAGPIFVSSFTAIGARRPGYDWRRHAVSSLAVGRGGWLQRANFIVAGSLFCVAAHGLARSPKQTRGPRVVPALIFGVGGGLIGSGLFVTDPVAGFPPSPGDHDEAGRAPSVVPTREGRLHNLCAIPIFVGIPIAALTCATFAVRRGQYRWASYSASSAIAMTSAFVLFGSAFGGAPRLAGRGGAMQRVSITTGFGWLSALSLRALAATRTRGASGHLRRSRSRTQEMVRALR